MAFYLTITPAIKSNHRKGVVIPLVGLLTQKLGITDPEIDMTRNPQTILTLRDSSDFDYTYTSTMIRIYANLVRRYITPLLQTPL